jgi:hypothetical protein
LPPLVPCHDYPYPSGDVPFRDPITGIADCCARAASGHAAAAPPSVNMNSRRRMWIAMRPLRPEVVCMQIGRYHALATERTMLFALRTS